MTFVRIGKVVAPIAQRSNNVSLFVPQGYLQQVQDNHWARHHLRFLMQKRLLKQDVFLAGPPSPLKRTLVLAFCEMLNLEVEMVNLSRDISESDLKQRRELDPQGNLHFINMPPLTSAIHGRVLFLDGVEKAERNVLPALNNLLENREMSLIDGRRLVSQSFFNHTIEKLGISKEKATSELGLIPASSDFQVIASGVPVPLFPGYPIDPPFRSRFVGRYISSPPDFITKCDENDFPDKDLVRQLVIKVRALASTYPKLHYFPDNAYERMIRNGKGRTLSQIFYECFPFRYICSAEEVAALEKLVEPIEEITAVAQDLHHQDICVIGERGVGKTWNARKILQDYQDLGYCCQKTLVPVVPETITCFKDMTTRDLIAKRDIRDDGSTRWIPSPLIHAAKRGAPIILDGIHRLHSDTLASLQQLIFSREMVLPDGEHVTALPGFRILCLAEPPTKENEWLVPETMTMFKFFQVPKLTLGEAAQVLSEKAGISQCDSSRLLEALAAQFNLNFLKVDERDKNRLTINLRQAILAAEMLPRENLDDILSSMLLKPFLPKTVQEAIQPIPFELKDPIEDVESMKGARKWGADNDTVRNIALIPKVDQFVNMAHQSEHMQGITRALERGHHILLIGNQGTGKNKLTDRLLQQLGRERQYMQLSRDSSVQSLTVTTSLSHGRITHIDSPLVDACRYGHVLVLDEVDKASKEVLAVLKNLFNDGSLVLSEAVSIQKVHPDFRVICLANRPGYPFLGNDFYSELGDCFANYVVDNGSVDDQITLIENFAPNSTSVKQIAKSFHKLREQADTGVLKYPYSTREAVHVARHLAMFPEDGVRNALDNVFAFDRLDKDSMEVIYESFAENGIFVGKQDAAVVVNLVGETPVDPSYNDLLHPVLETSQDSAPLHVLESGRNVSFLLSSRKMESEFSSERKVGRVSEFTEELLRFHYSGGAIRDTPTSISCADDTTYVLAPRAIFTTRNLETTMLDIDKLVGVGANLLSIKALDNNRVLLACLKTGRVWLIRDNEDATLYHLPFADRNAKATLISPTTSTTPIMTVEMPGTFVHDHTPYQMELLEDGGLGYRKTAIRPSSTYELVVRNRDEMIVIDKARNMQQSFKFNGILDHCMYGVNAVAVLQNNGEVSVRGVSRQQTQQALDEWLGMFSQTEDTKIDFEYVDAPGTSPPVPVQGDDAAMLNQNGSAGGAGGSGAGSGGSGAGAGGGGGQGSPIDRSDGWGGYSSDKIVELLNMPAEERIEAGLPVSSIDFSSMLQGEAVPGPKPQETGRTLYHQAKAKMSRQIKELKLILESANAKEKERQWLSNRSSGELDESKIVDSRVGEQFVYKKRGDPDNIFGLFQRNPKRVLLLLDTSASMARANDDRLSHLISATTMFMDAFDSVRHKFQYSIVCHSGSKSFMPILDFGDWPDEERKAKICDQLVFNARSAVTGDNTLRAAELGVEYVAQEDADEYFVILISDANLGRYNVSPQQFGEALTSDSEVNAHVIFLAEPSASQWLTKHLPFGLGHQCLNPADLPKLLSEIIISSYVV